MTRTPIICCFVLFFVVSSSAQEVSVRKISELKAVSEFRRMSETLRIVHREAMKGGGELELIGEQLESLNKLRDEHEAIVLGFAKVSNSNKESKVGFVTLVEGVARLEGILSAKILLPHQYEIAKALVFCESVNKSEGNMVKAVVDYHLEAFEFNNLQARQLFEVEKEVANKIAVAKAKFKNEMEGIFRNAQLDLQELSSPDQRDLLDKYQGIEVLSKNAKK